MRRNLAYEYMPQQVLNRHWVWLCLWFAGGIFLARQLGVPALWPAVFPAVAGIGVLLAPIALSRRAHFVSALFCLAFGMALYTTHTSGVKPDALHRLALTYPRERLAFDGIVRRPSLYFPDSEYVRFVLQVRGVYVDDEVVPLQGRALVRWHNADGPVYAGARVRVSGRLSPHLGVVNHGVRGTEDVYRDQGVLSRIQASGAAVTTLAAAPWSVRYWISRLRQWQSEGLAQVTPAPAYPFVAGVWLGERGLIARDEYGHFLRAGTAHVLAVSGIHVAIIALSLGFLLRLARLPGRMRALLLVLGVMLFAFMAGGRTATLRAATMISVYLLAELFDREPDALSTLGLTGFAFLVLNPTLLFDVGFQLSFGSVASIMAFYPLLNQVFRRLGRAPAALVATTASAQIITLPVAAWHFSLVPVLGIMANFIVVPLLSVALWLCLAASILLVVLPGAAVLPGHALLPVISVIRHANHWAASAPAAYLQLVRPGAQAVLFYGVCVLLLYWGLSEERGRRRRAVLFCLFLALAVLFWRPLHNPPGVDFIDVGRGDATYIRTPGGTTLLVDGGDKSMYLDAGERIVAPFLYANGVRKLDYVVLSHGHRDHAGGLFHILEHFPVGTVVLGPEKPVVSKIEQKLLDTCIARDIPVRRVSQGDGIPARGARITVVHPPSEWARTQSENESSLVLRVAWSGVSVLLTGDIEGNAEALLLDQGLAPATAMKAPHHGSPTSSSAALLRQVAPQVAVASLATPGAGGSLMPQEMNDRYADRAIPLYRTDWHGGVRLRIRDARLEVDTARGARGYCLTPLRSR